MRLTRAQAKKFAERFLRLREEYGTQVQFAKLLKTSQQNVSRYETGAVLPSTELLIKIAVTTKCSVDWLLFGVGDREI